MKRLLSSLLLLFGSVICSAQDDKRPTAPEMKSSFTNKLGMEMRLIPAGTYWRGSSEADLEKFMRADPNFTSRHAKAELPQQHVEISQPFYMAKFETTQEVYQKVIGKNPDGKQSNVNGNYPFGTRVKGVNLSRTAKVGSYPPNGFGLCDMHGNVSEFCHDYIYSTVLRPIRGGSWFDLPKDARATSRREVQPQSESIFVGFRVVLNATRSELN